MRSAYSNVAGQYPRPNTATRVPRRSYNVGQTLRRSFGGGAGATPGARYGYASIFHPKNWFSPSAQWEGLKFEMLVQHANWMPKAGAMQWPGLLGLRSMVGGKYLGGAASTIQPAGRSWGGIGGIMHGLTNNVATQSIVGKIAKGLGVGERGVEKVFGSKLGKKLVEKVPKIGAKLAPKDVYKYAGIKGFFKPGGAMRRILELIGGTGSSETLQATTDLGKAEARALTAGSTAWKIPKWAAKVGTAASWAYGTYFFGRLAYGAARAGVHGISKGIESMEDLIENTFYGDRGLEKSYYGRLASTQRQRALQEMQRSANNVRSTLLGNEARMQHSSVF